MKKIIYTRPDGGLSVVHPVINTIGEKIVLDDEGNERPFTEQDALERALKALPPDAVNPQMIDAEAIPADRTFREAWTHGGDRVNHDMARCREIWKNQLRVARAPKLAALDIEYQRADEAGDAEKKTRIAAQKQALRDVTAHPGIAAATTPEELKQVIPDALRT